MKKSFLSAAIGVLLVAGPVVAQAQVAIANADFETPVLASDSFETFLNLGWASVQWGSYGMTSRIVDVAGNQFAQVVSGDVIWSSFAAGSAGDYRLTFDALGDGYFMVFDDTTSTAVALDFVQAATPSQQTATFSLNTTDNYRLYFGSSILPPSFAGSLAIDNVAISQVAAPVPEPESYAMMLGGLGALGLMSRRRLRSSRD
jgi:hypothetical protein